MEIQKWKWNCFRKAENCTKIKQETPRTWLDNRNIKNTNRRDLRNLIGAFIQLLPFFCQRIKRFRLQFSTASVIKLPHSPCKTLLQCDAWMNSQFHFPWELWRVKMAPVFYSQDRIPCCWGWPCWWQASPSSPWLALCCPPPSPITTTPSILPPPRAFLWTMPMVTCHIFIVQIPSLYVSRLESLKQCLAILFKTRHK